MPADGFLKKMKSGEGAVYGPAGGMFASAAWSRST